VEAKKTSSEDATIEIRADFAFEEESNGCSLLARVREKGLDLHVAVLNRPGFDGGRKLDFAAIILRGGRDGTDQFGWRASSKYTLGSLEQLGALLGASGQSGQSIRPQFQLVRASVRFPPPPPFPEKNCYLGGCFFV
jgi:hypothetical protein